MIEDPSVFLSDFSSQIKLERADGSFFLNTKCVYDEGSTADESSRFSVESVQPRVTVSREAGSHFIEKDFAHVNGEKFVILDRMGDSELTVFTLSRESGKAGSVNFDL